MKNHFIWIWKTVDFNVFKQTHGILYTNTQTHITSWLDCYKVHKTSYTMVIVEFVVDFFSSFFFTFFPILLLQSYWTQHGAVKKVNTVSEIEGEWMNTTMKLQKENKNNKNFTGKKTVAKAKSNRACDK